MLATQGYGHRSTIATYGYGADGRGFESPAGGCEGEVRKPFAAELVPARSAEVRRARAAELAGPFSAEVRRPFGAEVTDGE